MSLGDTRQDSSETPTDPRAPQMPGSLVDTDRQPAPPTGVRAAAILASRLGWREHPGRPNRG